MGGLGNQMFQYAAARRLADKHGTDLYLDLSFYQEQALSDTSRHFELDCYPIQAILASKAELRKVLPMDFRPSFAFKVMWRLGLDRRIRPINEAGKGFNERLMTVRDNTYLIGWWQNENYFLDIRSKLLRDFTPKNISDYSKDMVAKTKKTNSVALHVRRGDYVSNKHAKKDHGGIATLEYYKQAIDLIKTKLETPHFYIFFGRPGVV